MARPAASSYARTISNLAHFRCGVLVFGLGAAMVELRQVGAIWELTALELSAEFERVERLRTASVFPGEDLRYEVRVDGSPVPYAEGVRAIDAALGIALDYVALPAWTKGAQAQPDPVAV